MSKTQDDMPTPVVEPKAPSVVDEKPTFTGAGDDTGRREGWHVRQEDVEVRHEGTQEDHNE